MSNSDATTLVAVPVDNSTSEQEAVWFLGQQTWLRGTSDNTGGTLAVIEHILEPGFASPYHLHHDEDESIYVIDGELRVVNEGGGQVIGAGGFIHLPREQAHGFCVHGDAPARVLLLATPGRFAGFIADLSSPEPPTSAPDMGVLLATAARYSIDILGPLPE
jgi:quercetin dioxygenase-like cupin family protein